MDHKSENILGISWYDTAWVPHLNQSNILDYFSERSNPFYDRTCNNEHIKMQRLNPEQMLNMTGLEYTLLHAQEPILYVIRKQHRHSPTQTTPLADYYIIAGTVYQGPDLCSVVNSRMLNTLHNLQGAFDEAHSYARFHPSKGYYWEFNKEKEEKIETAKDKKKAKKEEASSFFQRERVDLLLGELAKKYPPFFLSQAKEDAKAPAVEPKTEKPSEDIKPTPTPTTQAQSTTAAATATQAAPQPAAPQAPPPASPANGSMRPPPEKKLKLVR